MSARTIRGSSGIGSRNVPVQVSPCQMLNTATPVSAYQLTLMVRDSPRTSKKTSPRRGKGAASGADMVPMVTPTTGLVQLIAETGRRPGMPGPPAVAPLPLLFHEPFVRRVILPFARAIGAF